MSIINEVFRVDNDENAIDCATKVCVDATGHGFHLTYANQLCDVHGQPATDNERFLRHRPKRSERCLNYGSCTKAMARCQRNEVCPQGLSVKPKLAATATCVLV